MANGSYSLLGPMNTRPYALGERPGPSTVPLIPLMSGQEAFDSLEGYYRGTRMDSLLNPHTHKMLGGSRPTDALHTKIATLLKLAGKPGLGDMLLQAIARSKSAPLPTGRALYPKAPPSLPSKLPGFGGQKVPAKVWPPTPEVLPNKAVPTEGVLAAAKGSAPRGPFGGEAAYPAPQYNSLRDVWKQMGWKDKAVLGGVGATGLAAGTHVAGKAIDATRGAIDTVGNLFKGSPSQPYQAPAEPPVHYPEPGAVSGFVSNHGGKLLGGLGLAGLAALAYNRMNQQPAEDDEEIVAEPKRPRAKLASLQDFAERHPFVAAFLARCSEEDLNDHQIAYAIKEASVLDPRIKRNFEKAGLAYANFNSLPGAMTNRVTASPAPPPPAAPHPSGPTPFGGGQSGGHGASASVAPPIPTRPAPAGFRQALGRGLENMGNVAKGGLTAAAGTVGYLGGLAGSGVTRATDFVGLTDNAAPVADEVTKGMRDAANSGLATFYAGASDTDPEAVAKNWSASDPFKGNTQSVDAMRADHLRQLHSLPPGDTLAGMSPADAAGTYGALTSGADTLYEMGLAGKSPVGAKTMQGLIGWNGMGGELVNAGAESALGDKPFVPQSFADAATHPDKAVTVPYEQDGQLVQTLHDGRQVPKSQVGADGRGPAPGKPAGPPNPAQVAMNTDGAKQLVTTQPEQAKQYLDQAKSFVTESLGKAKDQIAEWVPEIMGGGTPKALIEANGQKLAPSFGEKTTEILQNMDPWQHVALWGGLSLGAIGIISAMTDEEGGIGNWIMALLGLGGAALGAGHAGLLGEGAQGVAQNVTGGLASTMGSGFAKLPDSAMQMTMKGLPTMAPELAAKLDQAAGVGGFMNTLAGGAGSLTGETARQMGEYGIPPDQVERVLANWRQARKAG